MKKHLLFFCFLVSLLLNIPEVYANNKSVNLPIANKVYSLIKKQDYKHLEGNYSLFIDGKNYGMEIKIKCNKPKAIIKFKGEKISSKFILKNNIITICITKDETYLKLIGKILNAAGAMEGVAYDSKGNKSNWSAAKLITESRSKNKSSKKTN